MKKSKLEAAETRRRIVKTAAAQFRRNGIHATGLSDVMAHVRDTQAASDLKEFRVGFNTSPWRQVSWNAHYRYSEKKNHYHNIQDSPQVGYSAFISGLERNTDEVDTKLVLHPLSWLQTTLGFR